MQNEHANNPETEPSLKFHVAPDLDYQYRDIFNVFVGIGDVVIEFGNIHRAMPGHATISNRIAMSVQNAYTLTQTLQQALQEAQNRLPGQIARQKSQQK